jgi:hypothetical protein
MPRLMEFIGYISGVCMGIIARDNYQFSMGEKMDVIASDYKQLNANS